jgi:hypothetical protein
MVRAVKGGSTNLHTMVSRLNDGILFCMEATAELMALPRRDALFLAEATNVQAVFRPRRGSIVTRRQNIFIFDEDSTHLPPKAGRAFGDEMSDIHEILFPGGPVGTSLIFLFFFQGQAIKRTG